MQQLDLNGVWKVRGFDGQHGFPDPYIKNPSDERYCYDAQVPGEIHLDLERAGVLKDCLVEMNAHAARWVEEQIWVYKTTFDAPAEAVAQTSWLVFEGLDITSIIYLNGEEVGRHNNSFIPCRINVTGKLKEGSNLLMVHIESGLYHTADKLGKDYTPTMDSHTTKRAWLRKPQSQFSWDWAPRLINVGIWKPVRLEWTDTARIDAVTVYPELADDHKSAKINARVFVDSVISEPTQATVRVKVPETGAVIEQEVELPSGESRQDISVEIADPKLWWPRPHGDQPLYNVDIELIINGKVADQAHRRTGIRSIKITQNPHPETGEYFILEVNGEPIFAKGGNFVPPDILFSRIDGDLYRKLVQIAVDANFNALRIWGGGLYADHDLLDACDEMGVFVWHDFIFACSKYPGDDPDFLKNIRAEATFITRDLSPHPSLLVWCGNNELEWATFDWTHYDEGRSYPDYSLFHHVIPCIIKKEDPSRPYWPSSPYSTDHRYPNDPTTGDQHPWFVSLQEGGPDFWLYRKDVSRFPNEGGVLGATGLTTLKQFLPEDQRRLFSPVWEAHENACTYWGPGPITHRYIEHWLGMSGEEMPFEDYVYYSGILQAEGLSEYSNNFRRRMFSSSSAIFWMYNDTWPTSHGWTIIDYYLRPKLSFHPVRRAYDPIYVIPVAMEDEVVIFGVNDTLQEWKGEVRFGLFKLAGGLPVDNTVTATLAPNASTILGRIPMSEWKALGTDAAGAFGLLIKDGKTVAQNRVFIDKFKDLKWAKPEIKVERRGDKAVFSSPTFVWGVTLDPECSTWLSDDVFDLLPGIEYEIDWPSDQPLPEVKRTASLI